MRSLRPDGDQQDDITIAGYDLARGDLDHAYAMTVHRAQGATVDRSYVLADDHAHREWAYTALSRHRDSTHLYITTDTLAGDVDHPTDDPRDGLARLLTRSRAKDLATDWREPPEYLLDLDITRDLGLVQADSLDLDLGP